MSAVHVLTRNSLKDIDQAILRVYEQYKTAIDEARWDDADRNMDLLDHLLDQRRLIPLQGRG